MGLLSSREWRTIEKARNKAYREKNYVKAYDLEGMYYVDGNYWNKLPTIAQIILLFVISIVGITSIVLIAISVFSYLSLLKEGQLP